MVQNLLSSSIQAFIVVLKHNNFLFPGKVDEGPDGKPLTQPCRTACGVGVATCISGIYQKCTAKVPTEEV